MRLAGCLAAVVVASAGLGLAACYSPNAATGAPCDLAINNCPSNQTCMQTPDGSFCLSSPNHDGVDAPSKDGPPDNGPGCYGTGLVTVCNVTPTSDVMITTDRVIDTAMVGGTNCESIVAQTSGGSMCLITARTFELASTAKLSATGPNPLVIVATDTLKVAGTIDVASHIGATERGAGAQTTCGSASLAGGDGGVNAAMQEGGGGGGGAGGSFGSVGAAGGTGHSLVNSNSGGGTAGSPSAAMTPTKLIGGCPGGAGGAGGGGGGNGAGGNGGGSISLIAGTTVEVTGAINASGAGGGAGLDGLYASGGAGAGGSGGMIVLDAPALTISGSVFANGGGGGGGGGNDPAFHGTPGTDPSGPSTAAAGGPGGQGGGGRGGNGFAAGLAATPGANGSSTYTSGGGGGGGAGIIRTFGATPTGGTFSPAPT